jgi:tetratricopeptide (TPR) repeat protein
VIGALVDAYDGLGQKKKADALAKRQMAFLEKAAQGKSIAERTTFDYHRVNVYLRFGRHAEALAMLDASEKAMPRDFNHPWRIALVHLDRGDTEAGLAAIDRALRVGYGARRIRLHNTKIDLLLKANDVAGAKKQLDAARADLAKMNPAQARKGWVDALEARAKQIAAARDRG